MEIDPILCLYSYGLHSVSLCAIICHIRWFNIGIANGYKVEDSGHHWDTGHNGTAKIFFLNNSSGKIIYFLINSLKSYERCVLSPYFSWSATRNKI